MINNILYPLFDFDSLVDLNLSVVRMIRDSYYNEKYFHPSIKNDDYFHKCRLLTMKDKNPLKLYLNEDFMDNADDIYEEMLNDKELENFYSPFDTIELVYMTSKVSFINVSVLCRNENDEKFINSLNLNTKTIISEKRIDINKKYDTYYFSDINDIDNKLLNPKGIYFKVLRFKYNMEDKDGIEIPKVEKLKAYMKNNKFSFVDPYKNVILPEER